EHGNDCRRRLVGRAVGMPAGAVGVVSVPVHPHSVVRHAESFAQLACQIDDHRGRLGEVDIFGREARLVDPTVVHPAPPLLPAPPRLESSVTIRPLRTIKPGRWVIQEGSPSRWSIAWSNAAMSTRGFSALSWSSKRSPCRD